LPLCGAYLQGNRFYHISWFCAKNILHFNYLFIVTQSTGFNIIAPTFSYYFSKAFPERISNGRDYDISSPRELRTNGWIKCYDI
jgi:hypothetical protein